MADHINVLLVEDNPADVDLLRENLEEVKVFCNLQVTVDGEKAMAFLRQEGEFAGAMRPDLVLLDLNMPKNDGREVLAEIKADPAMRSIPVVILTSSQSEIDIVKSYDNLANAYITKPVDLKGFASIVEGLVGFWFAIVKYPRI